jgi:cathepsin A (carboxypeptidase C)
MAPSHRWTWLQQGSRLLGVFKNDNTNCSCSSTGLLFELGPCSIVNEGRNTMLNARSWNPNANIIFLDRPVDVGYSCAENGNTVSASPVAGEHVYAFLELILNRFAKYAHAPFHIAAESYGGIYCPASSSEKTRHTRSHRSRASRRSTWRA